MVGAQVLERVLPELVVVLALDDVTAYADNPLQAGIVTPPDARSVLLAQDPLDDPGLRLAGEGRRRAT
jgi:hypothetical protein